LKEKRTDGKNIYLHIIRIKERRLNYIQNKEKWQERMWYQQNFKRCLKRKE